MYYELIEPQKKLNNSIYRKHKINPTEVYENQKIALLVELGELANEIKFFKYWKEDPSPNFSVVCKVCNGTAKVDGMDCLFCDDGRDYTDNPALEEYVDVLHFLLTVTIAKYDDDVDMGYFLAQITPLSYPDLTSQFANLYYEISCNLWSNLDLVWRYFLGLGDMLGFEVNEVIEAYYEKNKENFARQERGY